MLSPMRGAVVLLACTGCQVLFPLDPRPDAGVEEDAAVDDAPLDAGLVLPPACDDSDSLQIACYDFESNAEDSSSRANHLQENGTTYVPGVDGMAVKLGANSRLDLLSPSLQADRLTIDAWVNVAEVGGDQMVIDHNGAFALSITASGTLRCFISSGESLTSTLTIEFGAWSHVACTQAEAAVGTARVELYVNGKTDSVGQLSGFGLNANNVAAVGSEAPSNTLPPLRLIGEIDRLRVWNTVLADASIAEAAGASRD
jgi:hypothetical protein